MKVDHSTYGRYLTRVLQVVDEQALEEVSQKELFDGAMLGIVNQLKERGDEYSDYISAEDTPEFNADLEQEFGGVGVMIKLEPVSDDEDAPKELVVVNPPLAGTPAQGAGIRVRDRIVKIDGKDTAKMSMKDVVHTMRGKVGQPVDLTVIHEGETESKTLTIVRAIISVPSTLGDRPQADGSWDYRLEEDPRIGYIRITNFGEKTVGELSEVLASLKQQNVEALILDLRDNPGGLLEAAKEVCDMFLKADQPIVSIRGRRKQTQREYVSSGTGLYTDIPLAILVNGYSASASEIVAACLQDNKRAIVVGTRSYGKGTVQHVIRIEAGKSILKLTSASYWRPSGKNIHRMRDADESDDWGVFPNEDLEVKLTEEQDNQRRVARKNRDLYQDDAVPKAESDDDSSEPFVDVQLQKAVEELQKQLDQQEARPQAA